MKGGAIPTEFIPAVDKGFQSCLKKGLLIGFPVIGARVTVNDGHHHVVDSSDRAFMQAAILCKRADGQLAAYSEKLTRKHGKHVANAIMAAKIARAVYYMLDRKSGFSPELLIKGTR